MSSIKFSKRYQNAWHLMKSETLTRKHHKSAIQRE